MNTVTINIARDFSDVPAGRSTDDGEFSGERFRVDFLVPALRKANVVVILDNTEGFGSSFLEEAFGGLIRREGFRYDELKNRLTLVANTRRAEKYKRKAEEAMASAQPEFEQHVR